MEHRRSLLIFFSLILWVSGFFLYPRYSSSEEVPIIKSVEIQGNKKIAQEMILEKIKSKKGALFYKGTVQQDIKAIYSMGYFDDVQVDLESFEGGVKLVYIVKEKPTITRVDIQGTKELKKEDVKEKLTITPGAISNSQLIFDNVKRITDFYQSKGFWLIQAIPVIREISDDEVTLTFQVNEGPKVGIKKITIVGNQALSDKEIKKVMQTKKKWILSFFTGTGFYHKDLLRADLDSIRNLYHNNGYLDVKFQEPEVEVKDKKIYITITLSEGSQYRVGSLAFANNSVYSEEEIKKIIKTATGNVFSREDLKQDISGMLDLYHEKGYAMADINPIVSADHKRLIVDIKLDFQEGDIFHVGRINILGNVKTRDKVIRRVIRLDEGQRYNSKLVERSQEKINNLQYFETVDVQPVVKQEEKLIDLNVKVEERLTGMISLGGGYSSTDKIVGMAEITETNLFGRGLYLKLKGELSEKSINYSINLTDPWLLDKPVSGSVALFDEEYEYPDYDWDSHGFSLGLGKEFTDYIAGNTTYRLEREKVNDVSDEASIIIKDQEGRYTTSSIGTSIYRDSRNNLLDPTSGSKNAIFTDLAGLGGNTKFYKFLVDSGWYFPFKWETTFMLRGRFGYADGYSDRELPLDERFYVGGINTVRGIDFGEAGPRAENGEIIGGDMELIFNAEYIFPLIKSLRLKGLVFFDAGSAYDRHDMDVVEELTRTAGTGLRWLSPFGLVRLEWGHNLSKRDDQESNRFEFAFGSSF